MATQWSFQAITGGLGAQTSLDVPSDNEHSGFITVSKSISNFISLSLILFFANCIYNYYLHPISSYKGPLYMAMSDLPLAFLQLCGSSHRFIRKLHEKHGSVVRIGPNTLSFIDASAWNDIYGYRKGNRSALPRDPSFYNKMLLDKETISVSNDDDAAPIRRAINPAFSPKALTDYEPMLRAHIDLLLKKLGEASFGSTRSVDLKKWFQLSMFDVSSDFVFGEDMNCVRDGNFHEWVQFIHNYFFVATLLHQCHKFWPLNRLLALLMPRSMQEKKEKHTQVALDRVRRRINSPTDRPDFMHHFMHHAKKEGLSRSTIEAQATVIILAGSDTAASTLTGCLYEIVRNPEVYDKICAEVRGTFATETDVTPLAAFSQLPYLDAVFKEALRLHSPTANGFPRWVSKELNSGGHTISGKWVPPSIVVQVSTYACNTSAHNFLYPDSFLPQRWLDDPAFASDNKDALQPFSVGPRNCPGKRFATNNVKFVLARLLWRFDIKPAEDFFDWDKDQRVFVAPRQPALNVYLEERKV